LHIFSPKKGDCLQKYLQTAGQCVQRIKAKLGWQGKTGREEAK